ncbi:MAG: hypothetical protein WCT37_05315 [Patescibacteria group bacterium]|jgi:hypothetical protein
MDKVTIDDLAVMVKEGFEAVGSEINDLKKEMRSEISDLKQGQEEIKLKLDNVAYRFELVELEKRVKLLEQHLNLNTKTA